MKSRVVHQDLLLQTSGVILFLAAWTCISHSLGPRSFLLPSPFELCLAARAEITTSAWREAALSSLSNLLVGGLLGIANGISVGALCAFAPPVRSLLAPTLSLLRPIPVGGWTPFMVLWLGTTPAAAKVVIGIGTFWTALLITEQAIRSVRPELFELATVFGRRSAVQQFCFIALPAACPAILTGARTALGQGWSCLVAAELVGVPGLAQRMWEAAGLADTHLVMTELLSIGVLFIICDRLFGYASERLFPWAAFSSR